MVTPSTVKCAWCGATTPLTRKKRPKQHLVAGRICVGSGQLAETHTRLRQSMATAHPGKDTA